MSVHVLGSALKHGLTEDEIRHAWENVFEYARYKSDKQPPHYMALGTLANGSTVELIAFSTGFDWYIFHALTPPTIGFMSLYKNAGKGSRR